jgi:hypothetical protein
MARRLGCRRPVIADVHRAVGTCAVRLELTRPSYQQVRIVVDEARARQAARRATAQLLLEVQLQQRPVTDLLKLLKE